MLGSTYRVNVPRHTIQRASVQVNASNARFFVGGNWKCNGTVDSVAKLISELNAGSIPHDIDVVCAPTFIHLPQALAGLKSPYKVAAQNCWTGKGGAFTGEISADMLADMKVPWVILGHSERRSLCGETNEVVGAKVSYALTHGLSVIACIGETLPQRQSGQLWDIMDDQMKAVAANVLDWTRVVIAYEPVWAIGTGVVASPEQAQEVHAFLRRWLRDHVSAEVARTTRILYGGSVNGGNCRELAKKEDVDGFLVGGASLKGAEFVEICNASKVKATF